jgi:hypothetical protein
MATYPLARILTEDSKNLDEVKTYLEIKGNAYYQKEDTFDRREFHYFMGNSAVLIRVFPNHKADIRIIASNEDSLVNLKDEIKKLLDKN